MQTASGLAILSHSRLQNAEVSSRVSVSEPRASEGSASAGTGRFVYRHGFALFPNNILDRCPNGISGPKDSGCCHGEPSADDLVRRALPRSTRGCYTILSRSRPALVCSSPSLRRGHDLCERERPKASSHDWNTLPVSFSIRSAFGLHPAHTGPLSFGFVIAALCLRPAPADGHQIGFVFL
jgi:hypothetical protein